MIVGAGDSSTAEVGCEPSDNVVVEVCWGDFEEKLVMGDAVKGFEEVDGQSWVLAGGFDLLKPSAMAAESGRRADAVE